MLRFYRENFLQPCPSQLFVLSEIIDKFACTCQAGIMMKTLGNFVLFIWSKFKITSNLAAENLALRQQLVVMKRANKRPKIRMADRLFWILLSRIWSPWRKSLVIVKPDTVVHWHRKGFKLFWKLQIQRPGVVVLFIAPTSVHIKIRHPH